MLKAENIIHRSQLRVVKGVIGLMFIILIVRYFQIQIIKHDVYYKKAEVNRIQAVTLPAPRGLILDRNNQILVDNYPTFVLTAIPREFQNRDDKYSLIHNLTGITPDILKYNFKKYFRNNFVSVRLAKNIDFEQLSRLEENKSRLSGTQYRKLPERFYPSQIQGIHFLGYVREINQKKLETLKLENGDYQFGDLIGWSGLEKYYENSLIGEKGMEFNEVNVRGKIVGQLEDRTVHPIPGSNLKLTIDSELQHEMEKAMQGKNGSVLVSNAKTGEVLAYLSAPELSPELFTGGPTQDEWKQIAGNPNNPLLDRNTSGQYPPGSIFKLITLFPLIDEKKIYPNWETFCDGEYSFGDRVFKCWKEDGHGKVDMEKAVAQSCNIYFYQAVQSISLEKWGETCKNFYFGSKTNIDLSSERTGIVPDKNYLNKLHGKWGWSKGVMLNLALGQGEVLVTPLQLLQFANLIATRGKTRQLHLNYELNKERLLSNNYSNTTWNLVDQFLYATVSKKYGTGKLADPHIKGLTVFGKTGTAQNPHGEPHAWFLGYGKFKNEIISIVVLIENGGHGGEVSAPIARTAFNKYFSKNGKKQLTHGTQ